MMLVAFVILIAIGGGILSLGLHKRFLSIRSASGAAARSAADAGLAQSLLDMNNKLKVQPWSDASLPQATNQTLPNCDAAFTYKVTKDVSGSYIAESTGTCGSTCSCSASRTRCC